MAIFKSIIAVTILALVKAQNPQVVVPSGGISVPNSGGNPASSGGGIVNPVVAPGSSGNSGNSGVNGNGNGGGSSSLLGSLEKLLGGLIGSIHQTPGLNQNELSQLFNVIKNQNLTKSQVRTQIEQWFTRQSQDVQKLYNDAKNKVTQEMTNINAEANSRAATLSSQAKSAYEQYKAIISNDGISRSEECERLDAITATLDSAVRQELYQAFGNLRMCPKSRGNNQSGFNNNNNNIGNNGFGNQQQQNGFGGQNQGNNNDFSNNNNNGQMEGFAGQNGGFNGQQQGGFNGGFDGQQQQNNNGFGGQNQGTNGNFGGQQQQQNGFGNPQGNANNNWGNPNGGFGGQQQQNGFGSNNGFGNGQQGNSNGGFGGQQQPNSFGNSNGGFAGGQQPNINNNNQGGQPNQNGGSNQAPFG